MPVPPRRSYSAVRVIVALAIILPYEIATDFHTSTLGLFLVAMVGFGAGHLAELLLARRRRPAGAAVPDDDGPRVAR